MLKISKLTDYAIVILSLMAKDNNKIRAAFEIATTTGITQPTVSKILKLLINAKILVSVRGARGGYRLAKLPEQISVAKVISAMEGPIALTECSLSHQGCKQSSGCEIWGNWQLINQTVHYALESVTLADLIKPSQTLIPVANLSQHPKQAIIRF